MTVPIGAGIIIDIIVVLVLVFSLIRGLKSGAIKELLGLVAFILALPFAGMLGEYMSPWFSFMNDINWRSTVSFLLALGILTFLLHLLLWIPRHLLEKVWSSGFSWSLLGGIIAALNSALGTVLLVKLLGLYPVLGSLDGILNASNMLNWLTGTFGWFISALMNVW